MIDDEPGIAELVAWCLDALEVEVVAAHDLASARDVVRSGDIGLVLLDFNLGVEDGLEILPELQGEPRLAGVPFVAFSAHDSRAREAFERGVVSFVRRPFSHAELQSAVDVHLVR